MKFNEKLIELRKKAGLSQEELGYKLNVTRQTVSKWELGQTTPEMDKLAEMSKIFNISVDELINESEIENNTNKTIEDKPIVEKNSREKNIKIIIIGAIIIVIALIIIKALASFVMINKVADGFDKVTDGQTGIFSSIASIFSNAGNIIKAAEDEYFEDDSDNFNNSMAENIIENSRKEMNISDFNDSLEIFNGTWMGIHISSLLDNIITINKTKDRTVTVKYMETETQNESEIKNIKRNIEDFDKYEVTFEYDTDGFIYEAIIEKF